MRCSLTSLFAVVWSISAAQTTSKIDSLQRELSVSHEDTSKVQIMLGLRSEYDLVNIDSSIWYSQQALALAHRIQFSKGEARALFALAGAHRRIGDIPVGLSFAYKGLQIAKDKQDLSALAFGYSALGLIYFDLDEYLTAINNFHEALKLNEQVSDESQQVFLLMRIAYAYSKNAQLDSAAKYLENAVDKWEVIRSVDSFNALFFELIGEMQFALNNRDLAFDFLQKSIYLNKKNNFLLTGAIAHIVIAGFYKEVGQIDSAIYHAKEGLAEAKTYGVKKRVLEASRLLSELYDSRNLKEALYFRKIYDSTNEELYGRKKVQELQKILNVEQGRQRENELQKIAYQQQLKQYGLLAGLAVFVTIAFLLYRNNLQKQKANVLLQTQKEKVESALQELSATQAQLIQSEKMASLGELTAGIAHEIQNPLNFVNNFSEVNKELLLEIKDQIDNGNTQEAKAIADDLISNQEKINHHGKRADAIVKNMLQHSRIGGSQKELTDINAMADEYLRIAYHGFRAKDRLFNVALRTDVDPSMGKIHVIPADIGRVFLNLFNNAFDAVNERKKHQVDDYEPTVSVSIKRVDKKIVISVKDNGIGISQQIVDKVFQPFFTTKPTGEGTGLGLSLSYDIVKAHGGNLTVNSKVSEGAIFTIELPA